MARRSALEERCAAQGPIDRALAEAHRQGRQRDGVTGWAKDRLKSRPRRPNGVALASARLAGMRKSADVIRAPPCTPVQNSGNLRAST